MIKYLNKTVFNSNCNTIVNTVNCVGVMGAGLALEFSLRFPNMFTQYQKDCDEKIVRIGELRLYKEKNYNIINFPTKKHWKYPSQLKWIAEGLDYLVEHYKDLNIKSIAIPPLGCSNGGLNFEYQVKPLIEKKLSNLDLEVLVCSDPGYAEGKEKEMLEKFYSDKIEDVCKKLKISGKSKIDALVKNQLSIKRFYKIFEIDGIGKKTYEKLFKYYFNNDENINNEKICEQLSLDF